jgi:hypothetical protein
MKQMKKLLPGLQDNNNSQAPAHARKPVVQGCGNGGNDADCGRGRVVEIEEVNMLIPMMGTKEMILNNTEMMTTGIKGVMHVINKMKRGLANLNLQCLNLMVGLI